METPKIGIHIFRRDLRIEDNRNLDYLSTKVDMICPIFILTKHQILDNRLRNDNFVQFLLESLEDFDRLIDGKLILLDDFDTDNKNGIIDELLDNIPITEMSSIFDYTLYSKLRDQKINDIAEKHSVKFTRLEDNMLCPISQKIRTDTDKVYQKFTPYYNKVINSEHFDVLKKSLHVHKNNIMEKIGLFWKYLENSDSPYLKNLLDRQKNKFSLIRDRIQIRIDFSPITSPDRKKGGRTEALKILEDIRQGKYKNYDKDRDYPSNNKTTHLSAYLKLGCVSIREVAKVVLLTDNMPLFRELIWRDFYYYIAYHFPNILLPFTEKNYNGKRNFDRSKPKWRDINNPKVAEDFEKWKTGQTGYPIVDAGMRQLNMLGWMHNRLRMIVASFLIKDLGISWQEGEKYFATKLIDYDPCQNNGGWQWVNGSGVDSQPYNRIFNPWEQAKKWDPNAEYIKYWVPELSFYPNETIFNWDRVHEEVIRIKKKAEKKYYFPPMVNHSDARKEYLDLYH